MLKLRKATLCSFCCLLSWLIPLCKSHGRLLDPPSRASMWRLGFDSPPDYDDHQGYCGGKSALWNRFGGRCGVCGDPYSPTPRAHERGGRYYTGTPTRVFQAGNWADVTVGITANHRGWLEFRLCSYDNPGPGDIEFDSKGKMVEVTQDCLDKHLLEVEGGGYRYELPEPYSSREYTVSVKIPDDVVCEKCLFQWKWNVANSWGTDPDGKSCIGCGEQEQFYACADVIVRAGDDTNNGGPDVERVPAGSRGNNRRRNRKRKNRRRNRRPRPRQNDGNDDDNDNETPTTKSPTTTTALTTTTVKKETEKPEREPFGWFSHHIPLLFKNSIPSFGKDKDEGRESVDPFYKLLHKNHGPQPALPTLPSVKRNEAKPFWEWIETLQPIFSQKHPEREAFLENHDRWKVGNLQEADSSFVEETVDLSDSTTTSKVDGKDVAEQSDSRKDQENDESETIVAPNTWWGRLTQALHKSKLLLLNKSSKSKNIKSINKENNGKKEEIVLKPKVKRSAEFPKIGEAPRLENGRPSHRAFSQSQFFAGNQEESFDKPAHQSRNGHQRYGFGRKRNSNFHSFKAHDPSPSSSDVDGETPQQSFTSTNLRARPSGKVTFETAGSGKNLKPEIKSRPDDATQILFSSTKNPSSKPTVGFMRQAPSHGQNKVFLQQEVANQDKIFEEVKSLKENINTEDLLEKSNSSISDPSKIDPMNDLQGNDSPLPFVGIELHHTSTPNIHTRNFLTSFSPLTNRFRLSRTPTPSLSNSFNNDSPSSKWRNGNTYTSQPAKNINVGHRQFSISNAHSKRPTHSIKPDTNRFQNTPSSLPKSFTSAARPSTETNDFITENVHTIKHGLDTNAPHFDASHFSKTRNSNTAPVQTQTFFVHSQDFTPNHDQFATTRQRNFFTSNDDLARSPQHQNSFESLPPFINGKWEYPDRETEPDQHPWTSQSGWIDPGQKSNVEHLGSNQQSNIGQKLPNQSTTKGHTVRTDPTQPSKDGQEGSKQKSGNGHLVPNQQLDFNDNETKWKNKRIPFNSKAAQLEPNKQTRLDHSFQTDPDQPISTDGAYDHPHQSRQNSSDASTVSQKEGPDALHKTTEIIAPKLDVGLEMNPQHFENQRLDSSGILGTNIFNENSELFGMSDTESSISSQNSKDSIEANNFNNNNFKSENFNDNIFRLSQNSDQNLDGTDRRLPSKLWEFPISQPPSELSSKNEKDSIFNNHQGTVTFPFDQQHVEWPLSSGIPKESLSNNEKIGTWKKETTLLDQPAIGQKENSNLLSNNQNGHSQQNLNQPLVGENSGSSSTKVRHVFHHVGQSPGSRLGQEVTGSKLPSEIVSSQGSLGHQKSLGQKPEYRDDYYFYYSDLGDYYNDDGVNFGKESRSKDGGSEKVEEEDCIEIEWEEEVEKTESPTNEKKVELNLSKTSLKADDSSKRQKLRICSPKSVTVVDLNSGKSGGTKTEIKQIGNEKSPGDLKPGYETSESKPVWTKWVGDHETGRRDDGNSWDTWHHGYHSSGSVGRHDKKDHGAQGHFSDYEYSGSGYGGSENKKSFGFKSSGSHGPSHDQDVGKTEYKIVYKEGTDYDYNYDYDYEEKPGHSEVNSHGKGSHYESGHHGHKTEHSDKKKLEDYYEHYDYDHHDCHHDHEDYHDHDYHHDYDYHDDHHDYDYHHDDHHDYDYHHDDHHDYDYHHDDHHDYDYHDDHHDYHYDDYDYHDHEDYHDDHDCHDYHHEDYHEDYHGDDHYDDYHDYDHHEDYHDYDHHEDYHDYDHHEDYHDYDHHEDYHEDYHHEDYHHDDYDYHDHEDYHDDWDCHDHHEDYHDYDHHEDYHDYDHHEDYHDYDHHEDYHEDYHHDDYEHYDDHHDYDYHHDDHHDYDYHHDDHDYHHDYDYDYDHHDHEDYHDDWDCHHDHHEDYHHDDYHHDDYHDYDYHHDDHHDYDYHHDDHHDYDYHHDDHDYHHDDYDYHHDDHHDYDYHDDHHDYHGDYDYHSDLHDSHHHGQGHHGSSERILSSKCYGVGVWSKLIGIDKWCENNCERGFCPKSVCKCD